MAEWIKWVGKIGIAQHVMAALRVSFKDGEQVAMVEGVSMPALEKLIGEQMPEGLLEDEPVEAEGGEEED